MSSYGALVPRNPSAGTRERHKLQIAQRRLRSNAGTGWHSTRRPGRHAQPSRSSRHGERRSPRHRRRRPRYTGMHTIRTDTSASAGHSSLTSACCARSAARRAAEAFWMQRIARHPAAEQFPLMRRRSDRWIVRPADRHTPRPAPEAGGSSASRSVNKNVTELFGSPVEPRITATLPASGADVRLVGSASLRLRSMRTAVSLRAPAASTPPVPHRAGRAARAPRPPISRCPSDRTARPLGSDSSRAPSACAAAARTRPRTTRSITLSSRGSVE